MELIGSVTNSRHEKVSIWDTGDGYRVWNHEWAVDITVGTLTRAWELVEEDVEIFCED